MGIVLGGSLAAEPKATSYVFVPPAPPVLGAPLPAAPDRNSDDPAAAPAELLPYIGDLFYSSLARHLAEETLSPEQDEMLKSYRAAKTALQTELLARLYTVRDVDARTRLRQLEVFSRGQSPRIRDMEALGEKVARSLCPTGLDDVPYPPCADGSLRCQLLLLREAATCLGGLSADQRRLIRELEIELEQGSTPPGANKGAIFFSPHSARFQPPADLSAEGAAMLAAYTEEKNALKNELRAALNPSHAPHARKAALAALADAQPARLLSLEARAESIRLALASHVSSPLGVPRVRLPASLQEKIDAYRREKAALQRLLLARVQQATAEANATKSMPATDTQDRVQRAIARFTEEHAERYDALNKNREAIRTELARLGERPSDGQPGGTAELTENFSRAVEEIERWRQYRYYQTALLEPGLSPEQRRLLLDVGLESLSLSLPPGRPRAP